MKHQKSFKKLNMSGPYRRAFLRNQVISLIMNGSLKTTKARAKEVRRIAEKLVTLAREGNTFNNRRRAKAILPYREEALVKLFIEIAPRYVSRPGGYTRIYQLGRRLSDTAEMARVEWVL
ncbi:MAG: 50S ribosomal protein L17 [Candidatus Babeliaceae bacterium]|nr:50S ribosomal protein L17 [Candidatus Babeliaceae bacterium]